MLGVCVRTKDGFEIFKQFEYIDWGLHFCPYNKNMENIVGFHAPIVDLGIPNNNSLSILKNTVDMVSNYDYLTLHITNGKEPDLDVLISNLSELVDYAKKRNVKICIENLKDGFSSNPNNLIEIADITDCLITYDIGHVDYKDRIKYVDIFSDRIYNVHVYEKEVPKIGHIAPKNLENLRPVLDKLLDIGCDFWFIELMDIEDIIRTKNMCEEYLKEHR
ncbi:sugar phosphate isomerase/epimerase family protein [Methanotorris formicicus]|uniref:Xylose isomerase domain-containing protein TIM barrel n=1 Tax=Methanotorris formicicus Mc-S-70 TaxID=647171 RepID=H1KW73_9EURY|nr:TIM barrel protein [Methanotorris formicicus]EHP89656.1 Xylose isomerase domain-containing protein TIM barrel [Methanotorris formicicus Mc-S-70]